MLRLRYTSLGQIPYQSELSQIADAFPKCFTNTSILPILDKSISDGNKLALQITNHDIGFGAEMNRAIGAVQSFRNRFANETGTQYCVDNPVHYQVIQAVSGIYQAASGISAAQQTRQQALNELIDSLVHPRIQIPGIPGASISLTTLLIGVGAAFLLFKYKSNKPQVTVASPAQVETTK